MYKNNIYVTLNDVTFDKVEGDEKYLYKRLILFNKEDHF